MKTLLTRVLTPLAALAVAYGAYGLEVKDGFEGSPTVVTNRTGWTFTAGADGAADESAITAYGELAKPTARPEQFATDGDNYLKLSTEDGKLFFNLDAAQGTTQKAVPGSGLYLDTVVQFTVTDASDRPSPGSDDKFIIWLEANDTETNLCVLAKEYKVEGGAVVANSNKVYQVKQTAAGDDLNIVPGSWHRLTVKAASNINEEGDTFVLPAFEIYVDGAQVKSVEQIFDVLQNYNDLENASGDKAYTGINDGLYFPSMTGDLLSLAQVGFSGEGKIDDLVVTDVLPEMFPRRVVTVNWGADVSSVQYQVNGTGSKTTLTASGSTITVAPGSTISFDRSDMTFASGTYEDYDIGTCTWEGDAASGDVALDNNVATITTSGGPNSTDSLNGTFGLVVTANNKVAVTLDVTGLAMAGEAGAISKVEYKVGSGAYTEFDISQSEPIGSFDYGTAIDVRVTYVGNTWANGAWSSSDTGVATLSGTTFTIAAAPTSKSVSFMLTAVQPQVFIGDVAYDDFDTALAAVPTDGTPTTLKLAADIDDLSAQNINEQYVIIDFAGKKITSAGDVGPLFTVYNDSTLVFTNSVETTSSVLNLDASEVDDAVLQVNTKGTCIIQGGYFDCNKKLIETGDKVTINGGFFDADYSANATLPEGYEMTEDPTDTLWKLTKKKVYVAQNGDTKYETLKEAVEDAENGDTVTVIADTTEADIISLGSDVTTKDNFAITINNDGHTVSFAQEGNYPFQVAGASLTLTGSGTWVKKAGTASMFRFGGAINVSNTVAVTVKGGTYVGGTNGMSGTGAPSNLMVVYDGTLVIDGGTFTNYRTDQGRCARAEAFADKTASITINAGSFAVYTGTVGTGDARNIPADIKSVALGTGSVSIPAASTAKFKAPAENLAAMADFCAQGYALTTDAGDGFKSIGLRTYTITYLDPTGAAFAEWALGYTAPATFTKDDAVTLPVADNVALSAVGAQFNGWTNAVGEAQTGWAAGSTFADVTVIANIGAGGTAAPEIGPGETAEYDNLQAAESATNGLEVTIATDVAATMTSAEQDAYKAMFEPKITNVSGTYVVSMELTATAEQTLQEQVDDNVETAAASVASAATEDTDVTITATKGFYYGVKSGTTLGGMKSQGANTPAASTSITVTLPQGGTTGGFYLIEVSPTAIPAEN